MGTTEAKPVCQHSCSSAVTVYTDIEQEDWIRNNTTGTNTKNNKSNTDHQVSSSKRNEQCSIVSNKVFRTNKTVSPSTSNITNVVELDEYDWVQTYSLSYKTRIIHHRQRYKGGRFLVTVFNIYGISGNVPSAIIDNQLWNEGNIIYINNISKNVIWLSYFV